jgi:hypothetical protein
MLDVVAVFSSEVSYKNAIFHEMYIELYFYIEIQLNNE